MRVDLKNSSLKSKLFLPIQYFSFKQLQIYSINSSFSGIDVDFLILSKNGPMWLRTAELCSIMIYIDAHVHIYSNNLSKYFNYINYNFNKIIGLSGQNSIYKVIVLMDTKKQEYFSKIFKKQILISPWKIISQIEQNSLLIESPDLAKIVIISGKQLTTIENLEVLSIGTTNTENNLTLESTILSILSAGGVPVIPWGFGKWWGKRGKVLSDFITKTDLNCYFLGDNGGRPAFLPTPSQFKIAAEKGIRILPGSDPLPLYDDYKRIATYGFILNDELNEEKPAEHLTNLLFSLRNNPEYFGKLCNLSDFIKRQALLRLKKLQEVN